MRICNNFIIEPKYASNKWLHFHAALQSSYMTDLGADWSQHIIIMLGVIIVLMQSPGGSTVTGF